MYGGKKNKGGKGGEKPEGKGKGKKYRGERKWGKEKETALIPRVGNYLVSNTDPQKFI